MSEKELIVLRDLTDEELDKFSDRDLFELINDYGKYGTPVRATIKGLLNELNIKYDDLSDFALEFNVGLCNNASRSKTQIYINRKNSPLRDNIVINLDDNNDIPYLTLQVESNGFVHEEAYNNDGLLIYTF